MSALTPRGRLAIVLGFIASAALCAGAAIGLVKANEDRGAAPGPGVPQVNPTLIGGSTPTPTPAASTSPTPTQTPAATVSPTPGRSSAPATHRPTHQPSATPQSRTGLTADATLDPAGGSTTTDTLFRVYAHATDELGTITSATVNWGDGTTQVLTRTTCAHGAHADCADFTGPGHRYATTGSFTVTVTIKATDRTAILVLKAYVADQATPSATPPSAT